MAAIKNFITERDEVVTATVDEIMRNDALTGEEIERQLQRVADYFFKFGVAMMHSNMYPKLSSEYDRGVMDGIRIGLL